MWDVGNTLGVLFVSNKGVPKAKLGPFQLRKEDAQPAYFFARLDVLEDVGSIAAVTRIHSERAVNAWGGSMSSDGKSFILHLRDFGNVFWNSSCVGPTPFSHSIKLNRNTLEAEEICWDRNCGQKECNFTGKGSIIPPLSDRLRGIPLFIVLMILTAALIVIAKYAF
jgi:hypothetical protein